MIIHQRVLNIMNLLSIIFDLTAISISNPLEMTLSLYHMIRFQVQLILLPSEGLSKWKISFLFYQDGYLPSENIEGNSDKSYSSRCPHRTHLIGLKLKCAIQILFYLVPSPPYTSLTRFPYSNSHYKSHPRYAAPNIL